MLISVYNGYVHAEPAASRAKAVMVKAYNDSLRYLSANPNRPIRVQVMDNETSNDLKVFLSSAVGDVEYAPPNNHRRNKAERAIRDWKSHFISTLATCHPSFPADMFDALIPQAELTLNHMRHWTPNPKVCAWVGLHQREYDFDAHPIAPCGTRVLVHVSS